MDLAKSSEEWSKSHMMVTDLLGNLLNEIRDLGYNPSYHVSYDKQEHHLLIDSELLNKHSHLQSSYEAYIAACRQRDEAVQKIQQAPKLDLGF
jgi:hypothetical protein